jgi:hypothetical protein
MDVSAQLHTAAVFSPTIWRPVPILQEAKRNAESDRMRESNPGRPARSLVTRLTELLRLRDVLYRCKFSQNQNLHFCECFSKEDVLLRFNQVTRLETVKEQIMPIANTLPSKAVNLNLFMVKGKGRVL